MAAHTVAVRLEEYGIAVQNPLGRRVEVPRIGEVGDLAAVGAYEAHVGIGIVAVAYVAEDKPPSVGRPRVVDASVGRILAAAVGNLMHLARGEVLHHKARAVLEECDALAVGRIFGACALDAVVLEEGLFVDERGIGEVGVVVAGDLCRVDAPVAVALRGVDHRTVVWGEVGVGLRLRRRGDLLGGGVVDRGDEDVAARDECHLLAVGRYGGVVSAAYAYARDLVGGVGRYDLDLELLRARACGLRVYLSVIAVAEGAVVGHREEPHGVGLEVGDLFCGCGGVSGERPYVERAAALAQHVYRLAVLRVAGIAVLAVAGREVGMSSRSGVIEPDVARDGRGVVLAPDVLASLAVLIEERLAVGGERYGLGGRREHLHGAAALHRHGIEFGHRPRWGRARSGRGPICGHHNIPARRRARKRRAPRRPSGW